MLYHFNIECFQKISGPPPWRELEILKGSRLKGLGSSSGVRGLKTKTHFQRAHTTIVSYQHLRVFLVLSLVMLRFYCHASAQNDFSVFNKSWFKANESQQKMRTSILHDKSAAIAH